MTDFADERWVGETLTLDGNSYTSCVFDHCVLRYSGRDDVILDDSVDLINCEFEFFGAAERTVRLIDILRHHELNLDRATET